MKSLIEKIGFKLIPILAFFITIFIYFTSKKKYNFKDKFPDEPVVVVLWHGEMLMVPFFYHKFRPKHTLYAMISEHKDGELVGRLFRYLKVENIRGSSSRGAARVFLQAMKRHKEGKDIAITPDGPRGPIHSIADGVVALSKKRKSKIIAIRVKADKAWRLKSWDKFLVPKPFSTIEYSASEAFSVEDLDLDAAKNKIKTILGTE